MPQFNQHFGKDIEMDVIPLKPPKDGRPRAPSHLKPATAAWFRNVVSEYEMQDHHIRLLELAGEAWDRCQQARQALAEHGLTFTDRFGAPHARPEVAVERDSRISFARLLRELDLDLETPQQPAGRRPPSLRSNRRD
jgi:P27 family predicted phage terminase small subunit